MGDWKVVRFGQDPWGIPPLVCFQIAAGKKWLQTPETTPVTTATNPYETQAIS